MGGGASSRERCIRKVAPVSRELRVLQQGSNVFVTGATGLIGGELVRSLVTRPVGKVWALVRPVLGADPVARLAERMARSARGPLDWAAAPVRAVAGDLSGEQLDLSEDDGEEIRREADILIHCAAETSFIRALACRRTNISGTRRLIEFALTCRRRPLLVYISTAYVSGVVANACLSEEDALRPENRHHNEYTRSKAIAEEMVRNSGLEVLIVRPSVVLSAGLSDAGFARAILWFVPLLNELDAVPINPAAHPDVVPVQFVVDSVIALLEKHGRRHPCYHVSAGTHCAANYAQLVRVLDRLYSRFSPLRLFAPSQWTRDVHRHYVRTPEQRKIFASLRSYLPFLNMNVSYDHSRLRQELGERFPALVPLSEYLADLLALICPHGEAGRLVRAATA
jgi:thioester reductase-like protein